MHYRFYKLTVQDLELLQAAASESSASPSRTLWLAGLIEDIKGRFERLAPEHEILDALFSEMLRALSDGGLDALSRMADEALHYLLEHVTPFVRVDLIATRAVAASFHIPLYHLLKHSASADPLFVAGASFFEMVDEGVENRRVRQLFSDNGLPYADYTAYQVADELPDIVFYASLNGIQRMLPSRIGHPNVRPLVDRTVFIQHTLSLVDFVVFDSVFTLDGDTWLECRSSRMSVDYARFNPLNNPAAQAVTGHPMMDAAYRMYSPGVVPPAMPKHWADKFSHARKKILWNHSVYSPSLEGILNDARTLLPILEAILTKHADALILFRPHPMMPSAVFAFFKDIETRFANFVLDDTPSPDAALFAADAYIGDNVSSLYMQFLPSERPALIVAYVKGAYDSIFWAQTNATTRWADAIPFVDVLFEDAAPLRRPVNDVDRYYLGPMDGKCSHRVMAAALGRFLNEESAFIRRYCPALADKITGDISDA